MLGGTWVGHYYLRPDSEDQAQRIGSRRSPDMDKDESLKSECPCDIAWRTGAIREPPAPQLKKISSNLMEIPKVT